MLHNIVSMIILAYMLAYRNHHYYNYVGISNII